MQHQPSSQHRGATSLLLCFLAACGQAKASNGALLPTPESADPHTSAMTQTQTKGIAPNRTSSQQSASDEVALPKPKVDLPELPYDKQELKQIQKLDELRMGAAELTAADEVFGGLFQNMELAAGSSMNGTAEDQVRGLLQIIDGFELYQREAKPLAEKAIARFQAGFGDDSKFSETYRSTYLLAEQEVETVIKDNVVRRATISAMYSTYKYTPSTNLSYMQSRLEEAGQLRMRTIERVINSAKTSMSVADYKKGQDLANLLQGTRSKLGLVSQLMPDHPGITEVLAQVDAKQASRMEDVQKAREAYRFPARYAAGNAPANFEALEKSMRSDLTKSGYAVQFIVVASGWIEVRSPLGVHMYNQMDFYVAVTSSIEEEAKAGVLDILYVTAKTSGTATEVPFAKRSAGSLAQMLSKNL